MSLFCDYIPEPELGWFCFSNGLLDPNLLFVFIIRMFFKTEQELPSQHKQQMTWGFWKLSKLMSYITSQPRSFRSNMGGPHEYLGSFLSQNILILILLLNRYIFKATHYLAFVKWLYLIFLHLTVSLISSWTTLLKIETFLSINQSGFPQDFMYMEILKLFLSTHQ